MAEAVVHAGTPLRDDDLGLGEAIERLRERRGIGLRHGLEHRERERAADGGGDLRDGLRGAEALEPAREEPLERCGERRRRPGRGQHRAGSVGAALGDGEGQLFREQRIASRPGGDESDGLLVHPGAEDGARDARRLVRGERRQRDLGREAHAHQARSLGRSIGQEQQDAGAGQALGEGRQVRLGGAVDPVHVLDDHHERLARARRHAHADQRLQGPGAHRLRAQSRQPIVRGAAEQVQEEGRPLVGVEVEGAERPPHLVGDEIERVHVGDSAGRADEVEDGQERGSDAVGHALAREIRHLAGRQALAKLIEQARLADAGLADDRHETALPAHGELQMLGQELQLAGAPDEAGHASAGPKPRALEARDAIRARGQRGSSWPSESARSAGAGAAPPPR